jgi:hypothetical protein
MILAASDPMRKKGLAADILRLDVTDIDRVAASEPKMREFLIMICGMFAFTDL